MTPPQPKAQGHTAGQPFTDEQLANWRAYEKVRKGGKWNMFDPNARIATRLSYEQYSFVMDNYSELKEVVQKATAQ